LLLVGDRTVVKRSAIRALRTAACLCVFSCAALAADVPRQTLTWPPAPESPRIIYRHAFSRATDLGWDRAWWRKVLDWIKDERDPSLLIQPYSVAFDSNWRMIVADVGAHEVKVFDPAKHNVKRLRGYGKHMFGMPIAVAVDDHDNIYVADSAAGRVLEYSSQGKLIAYIGGEEGAFKRPSGLAFNPADKLLYVVDTARPRIFVYDTAGNLVRQFGTRGLGPGQFNFPTFIAIAHDGVLYVNDTLNFRVQVLTLDGKFVRAFGANGNGSGDMGRSKGIAVDSESNIYVADAMFSTVQIFNRNGRFLLNFGSEGQDAAQFYIPAGITIDKLDYIYVADPFHGRVQVFHYRPEAHADSPRSGGQP
jgi:DNA-binding beta-propeller fold protein YncE